MILAPSSSCCFCWKAVSQPSVSPLCDLINECWATKLEPLWGGHIWTLYIEIHICFSLFPSFLLSLTPYFGQSVVCFFLSWDALLISYLFLPSSSFCCHSPSSHPLPLWPFPPFPVLYLFLFPSLHLCTSSPSPLHGDQALLSPALPQEPLTSAGYGSKVVPLSLPAGSGSLCSECLNMKERRGDGGTERGGEERKCCDTTDQPLKMTKT